MDGGEKECACKRLGPLGRVGPLGADNMRQQLGRSFKLRVGNSPTQLGAVPLNRDSILVFTGSGVEDEETGKAAGDAYASALSITCHLDMIDTPVEPQPQPADILGEIEWGTDGTSAKAEFDWKHGTVLQVSGSFVRMSAFLEGVPGIQPPALEEQTVGGHIGYYPVTRCLPTRTFALGPIQGTGTASDIIRIPRFACKAFFFPLPFVAGVTDVTLEYISIVGTGIAQADALTPTGNIIPGRAHYVRVINNAVPALVNAQLVFELAL